MMEWFVDSMVLAKLHIGLIQSRRSKQVLETVSV